MNFLMIMLTASLFMSVMMLVLLVLSYLSGKIPNAQTRYIMWIILLIGLIIPFRPLLGDGIIKLDNPTYEFSQNTEIARGVSPIKEDAKTEGNLGTSRSQKREAVPGSSDNVNLIPSIWNMLLILWVSGFVFSIAKNFLQYRNFKQIVKRWAKEVSDPYTLESFEFVKAKLGLENKNIGLLVVSTLSTPMLTGLIKPVILLPEKSIADDEMELILEHELTHYKHKDLWVNLIAVLAISIHWFNPILYFCLPAIYGDGESYCDETVLKNKNKDYRRFYGEVIISMIEASPQKHIALSTCFYAKKLNIKKRLYTIMEGSTRRRTLSIFSITLVLSLILVSGSVIVFGNPGNSVDEKEIHQVSRLKDDKKEIENLTRPNMNDGGVFKRNEDIENFKSDNVLRDSDDGDRIGDTGSKAKIEDKKTDKSIATGNYGESENNPSDSHDTSDDQDVNDNYDDDKDDVKHDEEDDSDSDRDD